MPFFSLLGGKMYFYFKRVFYLYHCSRIRINRTWKIPLRAYGLSHKKMSVGNVEVGFSKGKK